jgi:hypothetical protein
MLPLALLLAIQIAPSSPETVFRQPQFAASIRVRSVVQSS